MHRSAFLLVCFAAAALAVHAPSAHAQWHTGYEAPGFYGGAPHAACAWNEGFAFGGTFAGAATARAKGVVFWNGTSFAPLGAGLTPLPPAPGRAGGVQVLLDHAGLLVAGGWFDSSGDQWVGCVAAFREGQWEPLGPGLSGIAWDLVQFEGEIIALGDFAHPDTAGLRTAAAAFDGVSWRALGEGPPRTRALALHEGELYAGVSRWTGEAWVQFAALEGVVEAMISTSEGLVLGGSITSIDDVDVPGIARWDGEQFAALGSGNLICDGLPGLWVNERPGTLLDFAMVDGVLHALGSFMATQCTLGLPYWGEDRYYGEGWAYGLARFENGEWIEVGAERELLARMKDIGAMIRDGDDLLVLGDFTSVGDVIAAGIVRRTAAGEWQSFVGGRGRFQRPSALGLHAGDLLLADGGFELHTLDAPLERLLTPGQKCFGIAAIAGGTYSYGLETLPGDVPPFQGPFAHPVGGGPGIQTQAPFGFHDLFESQSHGVVEWPGRGLALAREAIPYWIPQGEPAPLRLELYDLDSGWPTAATQLGSLEGDEMACEVTGSFTSGIAVHEDALVTAWNGRVVRWDGSSGWDEDTFMVTTAGLDSLGSAAFDGPVSAIASVGGHLYVAGSFTRYGEMELPYFAQWNGTDWVAPAEGAPDGPVYVLHASDNGDLWLGGDFVSIGSAPSPHLAVRRGDLWGLFPNGPNGRVTSIVADELGVWIAGNFDEVDGVPSQYLGRWTGDVATVGVGDPKPGEGSPDVVLPRRVELLAPHPNPFNPQVEFTYRLPAPGFVRLAIFDVAGRQVRELLAQDRPAGTHGLRWDGTDDARRPVASGTYFVRMRAGDRVETAKVSLVR